MPIRVIKKPLEKDRVDRDPNFGKIESNLYLGLLENTKKLKPGLMVCPIPKIKMNMEVEMKETPPSITKPEVIVEKKKIEEETDVDNEDIEDEEDIEDVDDETEIEGEEGEEDEEDKVTAMFGEDSKEMPKVEEPKQQPQEQKPPKQEPQQQQLSPEEIEMNEKAKYLLKFEMIKDRLKKEKIEIPPFTEHTDLRTLKSHYDYSIKSISMRQNLSSYRGYLTFGFAAIEYLGTQIIGVDISEFAKQQCEQMENYDHLLIELGERSYNQWSDSLPVEIRLVCLVLFNAAMFFLIKSGFLANVMSFMGKRQERKEKKMRGPKNNY